MSVKFFVKTLTGETWTFVFPKKQFKRTTVLQLKKKIREIWGTPQLIVAGRELEDQRLLYEYRVKHKATIHLVQRRMGDREGRNQSMETLCFQNEEVEETAGTGDGGIGDKEGRNQKHQQRQILRGRLLEDQRLLSDCGVKHEDTIHLIRRRMGNLTFLLDLFKTCPPCVLVRL
uniref:Ubiquitin-like domain-containing protein n=1 Tax=Sparus aurata TaxID=8175 RepID=A0A671V2I7_SPAAU